MSNCDFDVERFTEGVNVFITIFTQANIELNENPDQTAKTLKQWLVELGLPELSKGRSIALGKHLSIMMEFGLSKQFLDKNIKKVLNKNPESLIPLIEKSYPHFAE
jgi:hypothetical protein